ncbi:MAG: DeoR/GlpR family DNA-binding transcription regulator [Lachnospiraceae bacterium]|nr:DeoR/GlpR family DNA-binding transcription regulator [Lachnospiraceae bacterium]
MNKRTNQILELLTEENKMEVALLAEKLGVSQVTVRKDLDELEQQGIIVREHGFACLGSADNLHARIAYHYEAKKKIAARATELIRDGETLMIESGSCCALLAEALTASRKDLTIITNSAFIADYIRGKSSFQLVLLGGIFQQDAQVLVGPMIRQCVENFYVNHFFIGTDGFSRRTGFTNQDQMRAQAVRDMACQAEHIVILTESEKFSRHGIVPLNLKNCPCTVITDSRISKETLDELNQAQIEVIAI